MVMLKPPRSEQWIVIEVAPGEHCSIRVASPSVQDRFLDRVIGLDLHTDQDDVRNAAWARRWEHRVRTAVTGWQGVEDEAGAPVPFGMDALGQLCGQHPAVWSQIVGAANDSYRGLAETDAKNSNGPPAESSAAVAPGLAAPETSTSTPSA